MFSLKEQTQYKLQNLHGEVSKDVPTGLAMNSPLKILFLIFFKNFLTYSKIAVNPFVEKTFFFEDKIRLSKVDFLLSFNETISLSKFLPNLLSKFFIISF